MNLVKNILRVSTTTLAAGALLVSVGGTASATVPSSGPQSESHAVSVEKPGIRAGGQWCDSSYFGWANFDLFKADMDKKFALNSKNVWQAPDDNAVWDVWCHITDGKANLTLSGEPEKPVVTPNVVKLGDGTRMGFRASSKSGGFTIDVNHNGKIYKIHRK